MNLKISNKFETEFAYITYINENEQYINLLNILIKSVKLFTKYKLIVYLVNFKDKTKFKDEEQIYFKYYNNNLPSIYFYKPFIIYDSLINGLVNGFYIDSDCIITKNCDKIFNKIDLIQNIPLSPIHPDDVVINEIYLNLFNCNKTQNYVHASCVLFTKNCKDFIQKWKENCFYIHSLFWDETALNCTLWSYNCEKHYLNIIDPWYEYFYNGGNMNDIFILHGCKDSNIQNKLLDEISKIF
jgi:hypothetical protein